MADKIHHPSLTTNQLKIIKEMTLEKFKSGNYKKEQESDLESILITCGDNLRRYANE